MTIYKDSDIYDYIQEQIKVVGLKVGTHHRLFRDKWLKRKQVLDLIFKFLDSREKDGKTLVITGSVFHQTGRFDYSEYENLINSVLRVLGSKGIISVPENRFRYVKNITARVNGFFYDDKVIISIENEEEFINQHIKISEFCDSIQKDGEKRFPKEYGVKTTYIDIPEKKTYLDLGYDEHLNKISVIKEQEESFEKRAREIRDKNEIRENNRIKKVQAVGGNQLAYAIQEVIKKTILYKEYFQIELLDLGFPETLDGVGDATKFLELLKNNNCIGSFANLSNRGFKIDKANINELNKFKNEIGSAEPKIVKTTSLIETPSGTKWSDVNIRWQNGNDVEITLKNDAKFKEPFNYKELGFYDKKRKCPNILWEIISTAANYNGKMSWGNLGGVSESDKHKRISAFQKLISLLRINLIDNIFGNLEGEPIETFSRDKEYIVKINLIPEKGIRKKEKENWKKYFSDADVSKYETMIKEDYIRNPNQLLDTEDTH